MWVLIGCYSPAPDRKHDAAVVDMGSLFIRELENRRFTFLQAHKLDNKLYSMEYHDNRLGIPDTEGIEGWDDPSSLGLQLFREVMADLKVDEGPSITRPELPFLVTTKKGFHYNFVADDAYGNKVLYETNKFTLDDVRKMLKP